MTITNQATTDEMKYKQCRVRNEPQKVEKELELWIFQYLHSLKSSQAVGKMCFPLRIERRKGKREKGGWRKRWSGCD